MTGLQPGSVLSVPIFPLPNLVFFPHTMLPLHVFEPRYRAMVEHAAAGDGLLGVVQLEPGWQGDYYGDPPVCPTFGLGRIVQKEDVPGDRYNIVVQGLHRARVLSEPERDTEFRVVQAELLPSGRTDDPVALARHLATARQQFAALLSKLPNVDLDRAGRLFDADADPATVLDAIASSLPIPPAHKQRLLEEERLEARAEQVADYLVDNVEPLAAQAEA